jgi:calcium-translocating P-type ATPase
MKGLTTNQVNKNRELYGTNALSEKEQESLLSKLIEGFKDKMIIILLIALAINVIFVFLGQAEWYEAVGIAVAVCIANFVSVLSEHKNESKFQELQNEASKIKCKVYRDDNLIEIYADEVVKYDIIKLETGDKIPADGYVIEGRIKVDQSTLNGETKEAIKGAKETLADYSDLLDKSALFRGTVVTDGECLMKVEEVGDKTIYGKLSKEMQEDTRPSPLKVKLGILADQISLFGKIGALLIAIAYLLVSGISIKNIVDAVILSVTIIVMAVPEGLPMMIALVLSMNMGKMLKDNVLVRKINGIETAGGLNILFTDKTGTLTNGKLSVVSIVDTNLQYMKKENADLKIGLGLNNSAEISNGKVIGGNSTDRCLLQYFVDNKIDLPNTMLVQEKEPFNSDKKYSTLKYSGCTYIKGAPEKIIPLCKNVDNERIDEYINLQCEKAMRLIAVACDNQLIALVSIRDNIRPEVRQAVKEVQNAGVQVVMITGDRKETAMAIAKETGILNNRGYILTSQELKEMSDEKLKSILPKIRVIARALPSDKSRLVKVAQEMNLVVGMTGDGVNDSPALKKADVGFAMGSGTDVAKEAGDIVILDDNFSSIRKAILYGRTIFKSIRKFIVFQLTVNVSAVATCFIAPFIGIAEPLTIIQILWINLIMDTLAAIAFGGEPSLDRYLKEKPISRTESIINKNMISQILLIALYITATSLIILKTINSYTLMFNFFIFSIIFNGFNARTDSMNLFDNVLKNKKFLIVMLIISIIQIIMTFFGGDLLRLNPLTLYGWILVLVQSIMVIPIDLIRKGIFKLIAK